MEIKTIQQKIEEILNQHKVNTRGNTNVFCTSQELAYMLGKRHDNVIRDIEEISLILHRKGLDDFRIVQVEGIGDGLRFEFVPENQAKGDVYNFGFVKETQTKDALRSEFTSENQCETSLSTKIIELQHGNLMNNVKSNISQLQPNFRLAIGSYSSAQGKLLPIYYLDEVMYLCMLNRYNDMLRYYMSLYYVTVKDNAPFTVSELVQKSRYEPYYRYMKEAYDDIWENPNSFNGQSTDYVLKYYTDQFNMHEDYEMEKIYRLFGLAYPGPEKDIEVFKYTNSKEVADITQKRHDNVLRDITMLIGNLSSAGVSSELIQKDFYQDYYLDVYKRQTPMYTLSKVGLLTLLGKYYIEINYTLANFYVTNRDAVVTYEKVYNTPLETYDRAEAIIEQNKVFGNSMTTI